MKLEKVLFWYKSALARRPYDLSFTPALARGFVSFYPQTGKVAAKQNGTKVPFILL